MVFDKNLTVFVMFTFKIEYRNKHTLSYRLRPNMSNERVIMSLSTTDLIMTLGTKKWGSQDDMVDWSTFGT